LRVLAELKRRNVIRMAGLYLVSAWLIVQVAGTVLPMFGAPEWLARSVVVLLAIGFILGTKPAMRPSYPACAGLAEIIYDAHDATDAGDANANDHRLARSETPAAQSHLGKAGDQPRTAHYRAHRSGIANE
jgi:hypothetical protein